MRRIPFSILTVAGLTGEASVSLQMPSNPALLDAPLFWQAVTFAYLPTLIDRISNADVVRLGIAGQFRDRNLQTFDLRAFATALIRADNKPLLVGGARGALLAQVATDQTEIYDPVTDLFVPGPVMTTPRSLHTQTELLDGRFLITDLQEADDFDCCYNQQDDTLTQLLLTAGIQLRF